VRTALAVTLVVITTAIVAGCGYKTNPRPATATVPGEVGLVSARAYPDSIALTWDVPSANTDGSPIKDLSGFKVYRSVQKVGEDCENCEYTEHVYANVDDSGANRGHTLQLVLINSFKVLTSFTIEFTADYNYDLTPGLKEDHYVELSFVKPVTSFVSVNYQRVISTFEPESINQFGVRLVF